jgi:tetratricopeptide (TPR) repeat protein
LATIRGALDEARSFAARAVRVAEELDQPRTTREMHQMLASIAQAGGDFDTALEHISDALALAVATGDLDGQALALSTTGVCHHLIADATGSLEKYRVALDHYRQAAALHRRLGRQLPGGLNASNMAQVAIRLGDDGSARRSLREALTTLADTGGSPTTLYCVLTEGDRRLTRGDQREGLGLISVVHSQPALSQEHLNEIERILGRVGLTTEVLERTAGTEEELAIVVEELLRELNAGQDA